MRKILLLSTLFIPVTARADEPASKLPCDLATEQALEEHADTEQVVSLGSFISSEPLSRKAPKYPKAAAVNGYEGFVRMSFVVDEQGNVIDPVVEDATGHRKFEQAALRAIKKWKYSPAMQDGKPVQQCHNNVQFDFNLHRANGATRGFIRKYQAANALIEAGKLEDAEVAIQALHDGNLRNRYENVWLWKLDTLYAETIGDKEREFRAVRKVLWSGRDDKLLSDAQKLWFVARRFSLEVEFVKFADALQTFETLQELDGSETEVARLQPFVEQIRSLIASDQPIVIPIQFGKTETWFHQLSRQQFAVEDIEGKVQDLEIRCDARREKFNVLEEHLWQIPQSWGECNLMIHADEGTRFKLVEVNGDSV